MSNGSSTAAYVAPFVGYVSLLAVENAAGLPPLVSYAARLVIVAAILLFFSRTVLELRPRDTVASTLLGIGVFLLWIAPDILFGYRESWLFQNALTRVEHKPQFFLDPALIALRACGSTLLVPVIEELFWRGWLLRRLTHRNFTKAPYAYVPSAFWAVAVLFASEHGPYWEVGLAAGVLYNWWAIRTGDLANCIWAHAVTNGSLSAYVILGSHWEYWL